MYLSASHNHRKSDIIAVVRHIILNQEDEISQSVIITAKPGANIHQHKLSHSVSITTKMETEIKGGCEEIMEVKT